MMAFFHVWFSTKYRKWLLQGDVADKVKETMASVAAERGIKLVECETMVDHAHLLLETDSDSRLSWQLKLLKGRSAYEVFHAYPELKLDAGVNSLWQDGFESRIVPSDQLSTVRRYIQTQDERLTKYER
jgi:putative transposase